MRTANIQKKPPRIMLVTAVVPGMMVTSPPDGFGVGGTGGKAAGSASAVAPAGAASL